jgi:type I restriction enzyme, S subunit
MVLVAPDHIEASTGRLLATKTAAEQRAISGKYVFDSGDVVYSKIRPYLRKAIVAKFPGLCSADMYPLKPGVDISSPFILAVLLGHHFSTYAESVSVRSGMPKINRAELADYSFALPPLSEQRDAAHRQEARPQAGRHAAAPHRPDPPPRLSRGVGGCRVW